MPRNWGGRSALQWRFPNQATRLTQKYYFNRLNFRMLSSKRQKAHFKVSKRKVCGA